MHTPIKNRCWTALFAALASTSALASSHAEAPFITELRKVDGTDFYMFRSYEEGRSNFVTLIANYVPLQDAYAGPNFFTMDPDALYEIHVDNDGDAEHDVTFQFRFQQNLKDIKLPAGDKMVSIPLVQAGQITGVNPGVQNVNETYTVAVKRGNQTQLLSRSSNGSTSFDKPLDNIGMKTIPDYAAYANNFKYEVTIPGCGQGRVFVGQRKEGFQVNLGEVFDLINLGPSEVLGPRDGQSSATADKNITTLALEVPISCLTQGDEPVIGAYTTSSLRTARVLKKTPSSGLSGASSEGGAFVQVSRLGMPLVNEVVIGLKDKNKFNASEPRNDGQFADYVTNPTLPELVEILFGSAGVQAPNAFPRADLVAAFLTGVPGVNQPAGVVPSEMLRLNTALPVTPAASQNSLGAAACFVNGTLTLANPGCDPAGFPNGRRPGDDVVDIELRVAMGYLLPAAQAPSGQLPYTDGALVEASQFDASFPYLKTPLPGSPNGQNGVPADPTDSDS